ncbi:putative N-acetyltransferase [Gaertneriomyces semiglobifer]|nr:putative N-acetyltransferase [Gaertneriomyces semiglobifer]
MPASIIIRKAQPGDESLILKFVRELAIYEKAEDKVKATEEHYRKTIFEKHFAHVVFACQDGKEVGMALYFFNYSTWEGKPGLYLEDLMVSQDARANGVGTALLRHLAKTAVEMDCARVEWMALDWNTPAIDFYVHKVKAKVLDEWSTFRLDGQALLDFASTD